MNNSPKMEIWKEIEGSKDYYISNLGNIKHNKKNIKSYKNNNTGYMGGNLKGRNYMVHNKRKLNRNK